MIKIKGMDTTIFLFFLINACFILIGSKTIIKLNGINSLLTIVIGTVIGYFFINYMSHLLNKKRIKNNKFILLSSSLICLFLTVYSGQQLASFISYNMLEHVSIYIITFSFLILVTYLASKKINIIIRICEIFLFIFLIIFVIEVISLIKYINFKDIVTLKSIDIMNMINGINIFTTEFRFENNSSPWLANMQNTARDKNQIWRELNKLLAFSFKLLFNINFVIWAAINGITITINSEYASCV